MNVFQRIGAWIIPPPRDSQHLAEIKRLRAALMVTQQALMEVNHAQQCGSEWYTRGEQGLRQQVSMWVRKGLDAARDGLQETVSGDING